MWLNVFQKSIKFVIPSIFGIMLFLKLTEKPGKWMSDLVLSSDMITKQSSYLLSKDRPVEDEQKLVSELENFEKNFFRNRDKPTKTCQKCDACRAIAYRLDAEFEAAEAKMGIIPIYNYDEGKTFHIILEIYFSSLLNTNYELCLKGSYFLQLMKTMAWLSYNLIT